jgi:hypothetical protein
MLHIKILQFVINTIVIETEESSLNYLSMNAEYYKWENDTELLSAL